MGVSYCESESARQSIIDTYGWNITDGGQNCSTVTPITDANFYEAINTCLTSNPEDGLCTSSEYGPMPAWDVSQVTDMSTAFKDLETFNADISNWDVSIVTSMSNMFYRTRFNQDISQWDVQNVTNMTSMFSYASYFNQDISSWNVGNVTSMYGMLHYTRFNQDIGSWNVGNVTDMSSMFSGTPFDQDINSWNVSNVTDMSSMFWNTPFNQDISSWDVGNVTNMSTMFDRAANFNQDISTWDVSNLTNMTYMFSRTASFNQNISGWNVSNVTNAFRMFYEAYAFNQDLSAWDISQITDMESIFDNAGLSTENYDSILTGWSALTLQSNVIFGAVGVSYCESESARQSIIDTYGWNITDGGQNCSIDNLPLDGLLAYYPFNGNANDEIGPNDGTAFGASLTSDRFGNSNSAYEFNGTSDFISLEEPFFNGSSSVSNFTYSTWIYVNQYPSSTQIISGKEGYWRTITLEMNSNGSVQFKGSQPSPQAYHIIETAADKIILQDWNHIAVTFANETLKIYVNGSLEQTEILSIDSWDFSWLAAGNSSDTNLFGAANPISGGVQYHFEGKIDDFALWNRSFSAAEISNLNNNTLATDKLKLVNSFSVYPNPVNKDLNIQLAADSSFIKCEVYNLLGQVVLESKQTKFSVKDLPAATYFIKVFAENGQAVNRFIKK